MSEFSSVCAKIGEAIGDLYWYDVPGAENIAGGVFAPTSHEKDSRITGISISISLSAAEEICNISWAIAGTWDLACSVPEHKADAHGMDSISLNPAAFPNCMNVFGTYHPNAVEDSRAVFSDLGADENGMILSSLTASDFLREPGGRITSAIIVDGYGFEFRCREKNGAAASVFWPRGDFMDMVRKAVEGEAACGRLSPAM